MKIISTRNIVATITFLLYCSSISAMELNQQGNGLNHAQTPTSNRIIVKYRNSGALTNQISRKRLLHSIGRTFIKNRETTDTDILEFSQVTDRADLDLIVSQLVNDPDVEYAEIDTIMQPMFTPNDSRYNEQWHYWEPTAGINLPGAWDNATGQGVVVAVIDTGYRPHADLVSNILPGYDMISDSFTANDGDGRDSDAMDPGDAAAANECGAGIPATSSSWHGTHVAGTIAAQTNNGQGVAGIAFNAKILPVRALGKCGGYTSDIADGILWAAGLSVAGVPLNPTPANVINLSLGGQGTCSTTMQNAINSARNAGVTVVVAAGNSNADAGNFSPASCNGALTVAAVDRSGSRAFYSNYGAVVEIAAPGGDTRFNLADGILSTLNSGTAGPASDNYAFYQGTSMATPHIVGIAALLYSANANITPAEVESAITSTARSFPGTCTACGSGIADANAAVLSVIGGSNPPPPPPPVKNNVLENGIAKTGLAANLGGTPLLYVMDVPAGATNLQFSISGGIGDADIYVRFGAEPTISVWDYRPYLNGNNETVSVTTAQAGTYYVMINPYASFSGVTLLGSYTIQQLPASSNFFENGNNANISDFNTTVSNIDVTRSGPAGTLSVAVDIKHTYIGDLVIDLIAPDGSTFRLKNSSFDSTNNLNTVYNVDTGSVLSSGIWQLSIYDNYAGDTGFLDYWSLTFQ